MITGAAVTLDPAAIGRFYAAVKTLPAIAGVALTAVTLQNFRDTMAENMYLQIFLNVMFAGIIAFGVVYNSARVSLSERERELASLRVLGFTRAEISLILLGELAVLTVLALPVGAAIGYVLGEVIMTAFNNEVYRLSFVTSPATVAWSFLVVIAAAVGLRAARQAAARPSRSRGGPQDTGVTTMLRLLANRRVLGSAAVDRGPDRRRVVADDGSRSMSRPCRAGRWSSRSMKKA